MNFCPNAAGGKVFSRLWQLQNNCTWDGLPACPCENSVHGLLICSVLAVFF